MFTIGVTTIYKDSFLKASAAKPSDPKLHLAHRADRVPGGSHLSGVLGKGLTEASLYPRKYAERCIQCQIKKPKEYQKRRYKNPSSDQSILIINSIYVPL
jgi:hypothetical protein